MALGTVQAWQYPTIAYFITYVPPFPSFLVPHLLEGDAETSRIWYTRYEVQKRFSVAYFIAEMSSGFSGILAYGLMQMKGLAGMNGWRWINIIEGIFTVLASVIAHIILVGMPDGDGRHEWRFLSSRERRFVLARIDADRADAKLEEITMKNCARMLSDIKLWGFAVVLYLSAVTSTVRP